MESPALSLSRSPSTSNFAPGSHRRSHPNLQQMAHISLAPLTPKYPIDPADYSAYFDPGTSELHTSTSISQISALPSPGGILSNSPVRSRASSRTRLKRKVKSSVSIVLPDDRLSSSPNTLPNLLPSGALSSHGFGGVLKPTQPRSTSHLSTLHHSSSWLVQTGLALTESSRENKGQSWLSKRDSSTSLASPPYTTPTEERAPPLRSGRTTPNRSRAGSRNRRSRRELAMTPATAQPDNIDANPAETHSTAQSQADDIMPDWVDASSRAEAAATVNASLHASSSAIVADLEDEIPLSPADDDPYGVLDFSDHFEPFDSDDEAEMRRELAKHRGALGWFDGMVDVLLRFEDKAATDAEDGEAEDEERTGRVRAERRQRVEETLQDGEVEAPPEENRGVWGDVAWFGRMVARSVRS